MDGVENRTDSEIIRYTVHELRNIFCIVVGNLELLRLRADPEAIKLIDRVMHGAERADEVIAVLTALVRKDQIAQAKSCLTI